MTTTPAAPRLSELAPGAVRPRGWLADQLRLQADGLTGQLEEIWPDVGPDSAWLGGQGEAWERGPYYLDGLVPLAHVLDDGALEAKAQKWVEALLGSQRSDGMFGPTTNDDWWPRMVAAKVLVQHAEATGDERVEPFLARYFRHQLAELPGRPLRDWGRVRGADAVLSVLWLHARTQEGWLLDLGRLLLEQTADWESFLREELPAGPTPTFRHLTHCVNVAMGLKTPAVASLLDGRTAEHAEAAAAMLDNLDRLHGQVHGAFSGDEWLAGRSPAQGVETCEVVELMFSLEQLVRVFGDGAHADRLEQVAYNLLPAACDPQMLAHQYHQQANQVLVSFADREWTFSGPDANIFGLEPNFGCCTANLHQGWPKLVRSMWMRGQDDALVAVVHGPCLVRTTAHGIPVQLDVTTGYPFDEVVEVKVGVPEPTELTLRLRIPAWCTTASLQVAGHDVDAAPNDDGFATVTAIFTDGDVVRLVLPMAVRTVERDAGAIGLRLGPLVLAHGVEEVWRPVPGAVGLGEWEITARKAWNWGVVLQDGGARSWPVHRREVSAVPFSADDAPVTVRAPGVPLPQWQLHRSSAGPLPPSPVISRMPVHDMVLVPYGCARLRVAELPVVLPVHHPAGEDA